MDEWHATKLVDHVVNLAGKLVLVAAAIMVAGSVAAGLSGDSTWVGVSGLVATLVVGVMLWTDTAPAPTLVDEDVDGGS